jgi:hypothetical protein
MSRNKYLVVCSPTEATTNYIKVVGDTLWLGNGIENIKPICKKASVGNWMKHVATAETLGIYHLVFVGTANDVVYGFTIKQYNSVTEVWDSIDVTYKTPSTGSVTATTIATAIVAILTANPQFKGTATNASGDITLTAGAFYPVLNVVINQIGGGTTFSTTTPGVVAYGKAPYVALTNAGVQNIPSSTSGYTGYTFTFDSPLYGQNNDRIYATMDGALFINTDATGAAGLVTAVDALFP